MALLGSAGVAVLVTPLAIKVLRWAHVQDVPNERSSHAATITRGAGIGVTLAVAGTTLVATEATARTTAVLIGAVLISALGLADDARGVPFVTRLIVQTAVAVAVVPIISASMWMSLANIIGVVGVVWTINAFNFMDGINGIAAGQAAIGGLALIAIGNAVGHGDVRVWGAAVCGGAVGFMPYNAVQPRAFLGDAGSYFLGAWLALSGLGAHASGASLFAVVSIFGVGFADTGVTLARRIGRHDRWWLAHREHAYQRLVDLGIPHTVVALTAMAFAASVAALGVSTIGHGWAVASVSLLLSGLLCLAYMSLPYRVQHTRDCRVSDGPG